MVVLLGLGLEVAVFDLGLWSGVTFVHSRLGWKLAFLDLGLAAGWADSWAFSPASWS